VKLPLSVAQRLYNAALGLLQPIYRVRLWWRGGAEPAYRKRMPERFGRYRASITKRRFKGQQHGPVVWLHAVSLGETRASASLVAALRQRLPTMQLVLTCSTATGVEAGRPLLHGDDVQTWLPYDTPNATRRFMQTFRPALGIIMETEVWPNLMQAATQADVPVVLTNARLSERSLQRGQRFEVLLRPAMKAFTEVLAQSIPDAQRLRDAGAQPVEVFGNLKFDITPPPKLLAKGLAWRMAAAREVVLMASSREGEEAMLLQAWALTPQPRPLLLIVPRHPQRFDDVAALVKASGLTVARRSQWGDSPAPEISGMDVWLGDSVGEMPVYYACADVCLLGGSYAPLGGQNLIEAAACGCPLVMGPHTFNFAEASTLALEAKAAIRVSTMAEGVGRALHLAHDVERNAWVERAFNFAAMHRGATDRTADRLVDVMRVHAEREWAATVMRGDGA
jgi:3-deoxy-D-manno-octulosonic-acid transferase